MRPAAAAVAAALWALAGLGAASRVGRGGEAHQQWPSPITLGKVAILPVQKVARLGAEVRKAGVHGAHWVLNRTSPKELEQIKPPMSKKVKWYVAPGSNKEAAKGQEEGEEKSPELAGGGGAPAASPAAAPAAAPPRPHSHGEAVEDAEDAVQEETHEKILAKAERVNKKAKRKLAETDHLHASAAHDVAEVTDNEKGMKAAKERMRDARLRMGKAAEEHSDARAEHWEERKELSEAREDLRKLQKLTKEDLTEDRKPSMKLLIVAPIAATACAFMVWAVQPQQDS